MGVTVATTTATAATEDITEEEVVVMVTAMVMTVDGTGIADITATAGEEAEVIITEVAVDGIAGKSPACGESKLMSFS